jgi:hypothetical protein
MPTNRAAPPRGAAQSLAAAKPLDYAHATPQPTDVVGMPRDLWEMFLEGYASGFAIGVDRGRELADEDAAAIHRYAVGVVHAMARLDPWEDAQRRRRQRQVEDAERHAQAARPWPAEATS